MDLSEIVKKMSSAILVPIAAMAINASPVQAQDNEYASYITGRFKTQNEQGILNGPFARNGAVKIDGPKPFIGMSGAIDVAFNGPIVNWYGPDFEVSHINNGFYDVYARSHRRGQFVYLGRGSGQMTFDLGYLRSTSEIRIVNNTPMKNIFIDWVRNLHPMRQSEQPPQYDPYEPRYPNHPNPPYNRPRHEPRRGRHGRR